MINKYTYRFTLLLVLSIFILTGCGSKKKSLDIQKARTEEKKDVVIEQQNDILSSILLNKLDTYISLEPIDPDNPIILNDSTSILNARVVIREESDKSQIAIRDRSNVKIEDKTEKVSKTKSKVRHKDVKHKNQWWIIAIVLVLGLIIYFKVSGKRIKFFP